VSPNRRGRPGAGCKTLLPGGEGRIKRLSTPVKRIEAIVKPFKMEEVRQALLEAGVPGLTVYEVEGIGRQKGRAEIYRGSEYVADMLPKLKLEILLDDEQLDSVLAILTRAARTGKIGDGKIFVTHVEGVRRIRTGETGAAALE
jgi:nitrogen regulatory protein P-II 1